MVKLERRLIGVLKAYSIVEEPWFYNTKYVPQGYDIEYPTVKDVPMQEYLMKKVKCNEMRLEDLIHKCISRGWLESYYPYKNSGGELSSIYRVRLTVSGWSQLDKGTSKLNLIFSGIAAIAGIVLMIIAFLSIT